MATPSADTLAQNFKVDAAKKVKEGSALQAALHEGIALALLSMKESYTVAGKKGSLTSDDLVSSLSAVMCDFDPALPFQCAADLPTGNAPRTCKRISYRIVLGFITRIHRIRVCL